MKDPTQRDEVHALLSTVVRHCRTIAGELSPFCPSGAGRLAELLGSAGEVGRIQPVFGRLANA